MVRIVSSRIKVAFADRKDQKSLAVTKYPFYGRVIALNEVVALLLVNMPDAVEMWVIPAIDLADDSSIGRGFI